MRVRISAATCGLPRPGWLLQRQYSRHPAQGQRMTVPGWTIVRRRRPSGRMRERNVQDDFEHPIMAYSRNRNRHGCKAGGVFDRDKRPRPLDDRGLCVS